jgi:hypothetical protein
MRINGLLRAFRSVRSRLQAGLGQEELNQLREDVRSIVQTVEEICARHGMTPDQLPGPSRRVYKFLEELDAGRLPPAGPPGGSNIDDGSPRSRPALRNVRRCGDYLADRFWRQLPLLSRSADSRKQLQADIGRHVAAIEGICAQQKVAPGALEPPSRQVYCWLKFLMSEENLSAHLAALERAQAALGELQPTLSHPVTVHLLNMGALWRKRHYSNLVLVKISEGFVSADSEIWEALMKTLFHGKDQGANELLREFVASEEYSEVLCELESFADSTGLSSQGCVHNLEESFARVNAAYFGGGMARPRLVWNRALTGRKFGHYRPSTDTVMLSVSLDVPEAPASVVEFVMYHELLHKKHGITVVNGRRLAHTAAFRAEERQFAGYGEAERVLNELAREH